MNSAFFLARRFAPLAASLLVAALLAGQAFAEENPAASDAMTRLAAARKLADGLHYQTGAISLPGGIARNSLPEGYRYLAPADAETLLAKIWRNPNGAGTMGMIVPAGFDPLGDGSWCAIVSFDDDGYVKDDDAAKINYDELLQQMKDGAREANKQRVEKGYDEVELIGWAEKPRYDAAAHKLYWAKELQFGGNRERQLNYNIRILGRRGVLVVNVVSSMADLPQISASAPTLLAMIDFQDGHRYAEFKPDSDKVAAYGIAALVAGGIAAKAGFFKVLWVGILALKKFIVIGAVALSALVKKWWAKLTGKESGAPVPPASSPQEPPPAV